MAETRRALLQGIDLLRHDGERIVTLKMVIWRLMQDAVETMDRQPDRERHWLRSAERAIWPELARPSEENRTVEWEIALDTLLGHRTRDEPTVALEIVDRSAVERALIVMGWLRYVRSKNVRRDKQVFVLLASGQPPRAARIRYFPKGCSDSTVRMLKDRVLQHIAVEVAQMANPLTVDGRCVNLR